MEYTLDLFDVMKSCLRRWYLLLPLLLICLAFSYRAYTGVEPVYYGNAVIGITPSSYRIDQAVPGQPVPRNGLLDIGGAPLLANMAALSLRQPAIVDRVVDGGGMPDYVARMFPGPDTAPPIPLVMVESTAPDPASTTKTLELVTVEMSAVLHGIQQNARVPDDMMVKPFVVSPPSQPVAAMPSRTRATITVMGAGMGLSLLITVIADVLLCRRTERRRAKSLSTDSVTVEADEDGVGERSVAADGIAGKPTEEIESSLDNR